MEGREREGGVGVRTGLGGRDGRTAKINATVGQDGMNGGGREEGWNEILTKEEF